MEARDETRRSSTSSMAVEDTLAPNVYCAVTGTVNSADKDSVKATVVKENADVRSWTDAGVPGGVVKDTAVSQRCEVMPRREVKEDEQESTVLRSGTEVLLASTHTARESGC